MKWLFIVLIIVMLSGCISMVSDTKLKGWAYDNGFILAEDCPELVVPERVAQPHPSVPTIKLIDSNGEFIELTESYLMEVIITLFGTVEKYQYLVEIYEREYLNKDGKIMPDLTLEELKALYKSRLSVIEQVKNEVEETTAGEYPMTGSTTIMSFLTISQTTRLLNAYNAIQEK